MSLGVAVGVCTANAVMGGSVIYAGVYRAMLCRRVVIAMAVAFKRHEGVNAFNLVRCSVEATALQMKVTEKIRSPCHGCHLSSCKSVG